MQYRRANTSGGTFFFTLVTYQRRPLFVNIENVNLLRNVIRHVKSRHPFKVDAFVLLPDHLHCIWTLPNDDNDFAKRWRLIKSNFTRQCLHGYRITPTLSRKNKGEQCVWQRRYWEHQIRNELDFVKHVDYIHYNPVKHGYVKNVCDWPYSSFLHFVKAGIYANSWGSKGEITFNDDIACE